MRYDLDVIRCTVEVRKDKRYFIVCYLRTVAAAGLALFAEYVHKLVFRHCIDKFSAFGRKLMVELFSCFKYLFGSSLRLRISVTETQRCVRKCKWIGKSCPFRLVTV